MMNRPINFKTDNLWLLMIRMAIPGIMSMLLISINVFIDAIYIGYFINQDALAGISLIFPLTLVTTSSMVFIAFGCSSLLSRAIGAQNDSLQQTIYNHVLTLSLIASIILIILGYFFCEQFITWMGGGGALLKYGLAYYKVYISGTFFYVFGMASNALIRAQGNIKQAMSYTAIAVVLNIVLAPVLIHFLNLGVAGAALASVIAMGIYTILTTRYLLSNSSPLRIGLVRFYLEKKILLQIASVGLSAFILQITSFVRQAIMFRTVAIYGSDSDLAFFAALYRIFSFSVIPVFGLLQSLQPIVGINFGAGNYERSKRAVTVFRIGGVLLLTLISIPIILIPEALLSVMLPGRIFTSQELLNFRIVFFVIPLLPLASSGIIYFQAVGKGKVSSLLSAGREIILFIPLIYLVPIYYGMAGIYYGIALENFIYVVIVFSITQVVLRKRKVFQLNVV